MPTITKERAGPERWWGMKLEEAVKRLGRQELDVDDVEVVFDKKRRPTAKDKRVRLRRRFRLVGVRHPDSGELHLYLTNVGRDLMTAEQIRVSYTARWTVELVMKELKSCYQMQRLPSQREEVVRALILCSAIRLMVSRVALNSLRQRLLASAHRRWKDEGLLDHFEQMLANRTGYLRFANAWNRFPCC